MAASDGLRQEAVPSFAQHMIRGRKTDFYSIVAGCRSNYPKQALVFSALPGWYYTSAECLTRRFPATLLSSSMAEHPAVNRRVVGSSPT